MDQSKDLVRLGEYVLTRHQDMLSNRKVWDTLWQDIADFCLPRKAEITNKREYPDTHRNDVLFDSTAIYANAVLANGQLSYMSPADSRWFVYEPPSAVKGNDKAKTWFQQCSEIVQLNLANSNFYSEVHELYFDDGTFGSYAMFCEPGRRNPVTFTTFPCGSFCISEDDEGLVDTLFRELKMTCLQAADKFGEENLSEKMRKQVEEYRKTGKGGNSLHDFVHAIYPRRHKDRDASKKDGENKPIASVYVDKASKHVVRSSGFDEQPFFAGRHMKWGDSPYGWSPGWMALPEARQLNFLVKQMDALAEVKAFPRVLIPSTHEGEIDLRSGGFTYFDPMNPNAKPQEWLTQGEYQAGLEREQRKEKAIQRAFHVDLFQMFAMLDQKQMTAREVAERASEKLVQFSPTFARKTTELFNPLLRRVFNIHLRQGLFPPPPPDVIVMNEVTGIPEIPEPEVTYTSRVALAIKSLHNLAFMRTMERLAPLIPLKPEILDNFDMDNVSRDLGRNDGVPADWITDEDERDKMREERAAQMQAAQEQQNMMAQADMAAKAGSIKSDSMVGQALQQSL
jgi:hypothetical protein